MGEAAKKNCHDHPHLELQLSLPGTFSVEETENLVNGESGVSESTLNVITSQIHESKVRKSKSNLNLAPKRKDDPKKLKCMENEVCGDGDDADSASLMAPGKGESAIFAIPLINGDYSWVDRDVLCTPSRFSSRTEELRRLTNLSRMEDGYEVKIPSSNERLCFVPSSGVYMYSFLFEKLGFRLPFTEFEMKLMHKLNVAPSQIHPNGWAFIRAYQVVCKLLGQQEPSFELFLFLFKVVRTPGNIGRAWVTFQSISGLAFMKSYPYSHRDFRDEFFRVEPTIGARACWDASVGEERLDRFPLAWSRYHFSLKAGDYRTPESQLSEDDIELCNLFRDSVQDDGTFLFQCRDLLHSNLSSIRLLLGKMGAPYSIMRALTRAKAIANNKENMLGVDPTNVIFSPHASSPGPILHEDGWAECGSSRRHESSNDPSIHKKARDIQIDAIAMKKKDQEFLAKSPNYYQLNGIVPGSLQDAPMARYMHDMILVDLEKKTEKLKDYEQIIGGLERKVSLLEEENGSAQKLLDELTQFVTRLSEDLIKRYHKLVGCDEERKSVEAQKKALEIKIHDFKEAAETRRNAC